MSGCPIAAGFPHSNNVIMNISFHSETPAVQQYMQHPLTIKWIKATHNLQFDDKFPASQIRPAYKPLQS